MEVQIIGAKKCPDTRKAERFFRERGVKVHLVDLYERGLSRGELENIARHLPIEELLDPGSRVFKDRGLAYMVFDPLQELLEHPLLLKTPVIRFGPRVTVGYAPEIWKQWMNA